MGITLLKGDNGAVEVSKVRYRPTHSSVLIRRLDRERTRGGLYLPSNLEKSLREGIVLSLGPGRLLESGQRSPINLSVGDVIVFSDAAALAFDPESPDLRIILEDNVLCVRLERGE